MRRMMAVMLLTGVLASRVAAQDQTTVFARDTLYDRSTWRQFMRDHPEMFRPRPDLPAPVTPPAGTVPVAQLQIPDKALKELKRSDKALRAGDVRLSMEHIKKALAIYPELPDGHSALAVRYVALKEYSNAVGEFDKELAVRPNHRPTLDNLAALLCIQHRYTEAEPVARRALNAEPFAPTSQYLLGSTLVEEGKYSDEATDLLEMVKTRYARARLFLARAEEGRGDVAPAREELREYLRGGSSEYREMAQEWLTRLENQGTETTRAEQADHDN